MPSQAQASERLPKKVDHQVNLVPGEEAPPTISSSVDIKTTSLSSEDQSATGPRSRNGVTNRFDLSDLLVAIAVPPRLGQPALGGPRRTHVQPRIRGGPRKAVPSYLI